MDSMPIVVSDITTFFTSSTRADNDSANKIREKILELISNDLSKYDEYKKHTEFGKSWKLVGEEWFNIIKIKHVMPSAVYIVYYLYYLYYIYYYYY